jgi:hypothetical protein
VPRERFGEMFWPEFDRSTQQERRSNDCVRCGVAELIGCRRLAGVLNPIAPRQKRRLADEPIDWLLAFVARVCGTLGGGPTQPLGDPERGAGEARAGGSVGGRPKMVGCGVCTGLAAFVGGFTQEAASHLALRALKDCALKKLIHRLTLATHAQSLQRPAGLTQRTPRNC